MAKKTIKKYTFTIGRRKASVVTLKMYSGKGKNLANNIPLDKYFVVAKRVQNALFPLIVTGTQAKYYFEAKLSGGGKAGQSDAVKLAVARALDKINDKYHQALKAEKFLTVDSRVKERQKVGTGGKARRQKQSPKR